MSNKTMRYLQVILVLVIVIASSTFTNTISNKEEISDEIVNHKFENVNNEFAIKSARYGCIDFMLFNDIVYCTDWGGLRFLDLNNLTKTILYFS